MSEIQSRTLDFRQLRV